MTATLSNDRFQIFLPLTKIDEEHRLVYGRATEQVVDSAREVCDVASSVPYFRKWSEGAEKRTGGKSKGNVREMHRPVAAGKVLDIQYAEKAIDIETFCSDDDVWRKILDGTLSGFSVGGRYVKRWPDPENPGAWRYTAEPQEISYVDAPSVPTATFTFIKLDGTSEERVLGKAVADPQGHLAVAALADLSMATVGQNAIEITNENHPEQNADCAQETKPISEPVRSADIVDMKGPGWIEKLSATVSQLADAVSEVGRLRKEDEDRLVKIESELKLRGERVGISRREGSPLTVPESSPIDWHEYADPANWSYPMSKMQASAQVDRYNRGLDLQKYTLREWKILGRRITRMASDALDVQFRFSPQDNQIERIEKAMATEMKKNVDVAGLLRDVGSQLSQAVDQIGKDPDATKNLLMQALAALDVAADTQVVGGEGATPHPPVTAGAETLKAGPTPIEGGGTVSASSSSTSSPMAAGTMMKGPEATPSAPQPPASKPAPPAAPAAPSGDEDEEYKTYKTYKAMYKDEQAQQIERLTETVEKLAAALKADPAPKPAPGGDVAEPKIVEPKVAPAVKKTDGPLGDLNALVKLDSQESKDEALEILSAGGPNAYQKAIGAILAKNPTISINAASSELQKRVQETVARSIHAGGVASADRLKILDIDALFANRQ